MTVHNTILAGTAGGAPLCDGTPSSLGANLAGDTSCHLSGAGDREGVDPLLGSPSTE